VLFLILLAVGTAVLAPLRTEGSEDDAGEAAGRIADLELRKESKYAEIRDAEAEFHAGKLSREDYRELDRALRREAIAILEEIDRAREEPGEPPAKADGNTGD
jgi:hypothetical protein